MTDWILYGILAILAGSVLAIAFTLRKLNQVQRDLDHERRILHGHDLSEIEHKILLMRVAGFKLDVIAQAVGCDASTVDRYIRVLKNTGHLVDEA